MCSGEGGVVELSDCLEEVVEVGLDEDGLGAFGGNGCERRVVDAAGFYRAVFGEVIDDQIDEGELGAADGTAGAGYLYTDTPLGGTR